MKVILGLLRLMKDKDSDITQVCEKLDDLFFGGGSDSGGKKAECLKSLILQFTKGQQQEVLFRHFNGKI